MARSFTPRNAVVAVACLLALSGCGTADGLFGKEMTAACPVAGKLDTGDRLVRFGEGPGREEANVTLAVEVTHVLAACAFEAEENSGEVELSLWFRARRGQAGTGKEDRFGYFVAVVSPDDEVITRRTFERELELADEGAWTTFSDQLEVGMSVAEGVDLSVYRIYVGLELSPEQLEYNRSFRQ